MSDVETGDFFLLVGANPAVSAWNWVESVPGGWKWAPRSAQGAKIVVVDPNRTETADKADTHLAQPPWPGLGAAAGHGERAIDEGLEHRDDCADLALGVSELRGLIAAADLDDLAARCDIPRTISKRWQGILPRRRARR